LNRTGVAHRARWRRRGVRGYGHSDGSAWPGQVEPVSDVLIWALVVVAILAVQASEAASPQEATAQPRRPGETFMRTLADPFATPASVARAVIMLGAGFVVLVGVISLAGVSTGTGSDVDRNQLAVSGALQLAAGLATFALYWYGTSRIPGFRLLRDGAPISWLAILLFLEGLAGNLAPAGTTTTGGTSNLRPSAGPSAESLMLGSVPFLVVGLASVGPVVKRSVLAAAERLGFWPLRLPWWVVGVGVGMLLVPVGGVLGDLLNHLVSAACVAHQNQAEQAIVGVGRTALEQAGVAIAAGVCEETLFRGALQPRFGIFLSSALWASYHLQYACNGFPSSSNLYLLLLGFIFGGLRKYGGLWPAILAHATYDGIILLHLLGT
jgi:membrane protease YdiL (CAAX protease family)